ncbi:hypothetical protein D3C83_31170 [compost metagenome]
MTNDNVRQQDRRHHGRGVNEAAHHHPDDRECRLRIPGRDIERPDRIDVAGPVKRDVAGRKNGRVAEVFEEFHRGICILRRAFRQGK